MTEHVRGLNRRFRLLWLATAVSGLGDGLVLVAFPLLAAELTDDARLIVGITVAARLPWIIASLPAGAIADRVDRRRLLARVEGGRMVVLLVFGACVATGHDSLPVLYVTVFLVGLGQTAFDAATHAILPTLVLERDLARANGRILAAETVTADTLGPALGGALFGVAAALPFVLDGASFAASGVLLLLAVPIGVAIATPERNLREDISLGWRHFRRDALLVSLAIMIATFSFCQAMVVGPLVLFALNALGVSGVGFGLLLAFSAVGNVIGALTASRLDQRVGTGLLIPASGAAAGAGYLILGTAPGVVVAAAGLAIEGIAIAVGNVASLALRQRVVPGELLGRVGNTFRLFIFGSMPIGALAGGVLSYSIGERAPMIAAAAIQLGATVVLGPRLARLVAQRQNDGAT